MPTAGPNPRRLLHPAVGLVLAGALAAGALAAAAPAPSAGRLALTAETARTAARQESQPAGPTTLRMASFNLLGAGHTDGRNPRGGYAKSGKRLKWAVRALEEESVQVVGFQEMQGPQARAFHKRYGDAWRLFPGTALSERAGHNSIAWRSSAWEAVRTETVNIPYFHGNPFPMPYVLLRSRATGQRLWLLNVHNPADAYGKAQKWRNAAVRKEIGLINDLRRDYPGVPVFLTGDMNDHEEFFCPMVQQTDLASASGGSATSTTCTTPEVMKVDWLLGSRDLNTFTSYLVRRDDLVAKATDHPLVAATVSIPSPQMRARALKRVVVLAVDGLRGKTLRTLGATQLPHLFRMRSEGASTLNARTTADSTLPLPNLMSMLTGVGADPATGGHGVLTDTDPGTTVHATAGRYLQSVFERVHNAGRSTNLFTTDPAAEVVARSWDATSGAMDRQWVDNGRNKISRVVRSTGNGATADALVDRLSGKTGALTVAQLTNPLLAGRADGFGGAAYQDSVRAVDRYVGRVLDAISARPRMRTNTVVLLTGTSGGTTNSDPDAPLRPADYAVPLIAWGAGVAPGADLYALNPAWADPGHRRTARGDSPAIHVGVVANLALSLLRLPALSNSTYDPGQRFTIFR